MTHPPPHSAPWRPTPRFWAAFFPLLIALDYVRAYWLPRFPLGISGRDLTLLFQVEFLVIHSFPFLVAISRLGPLTGRKPGCLAVLFWGLLAVYLLASFTMGWKGPLFFLCATAATYLGFWFRRMEAMALFLLGVRWLLSTILYMVLISSCGLSNNVDRWYPGHKTFLAGFLYFLALGLLEASGFYQKPFWAKAKEMWDQGRSRPR